MTTPSRRLLDRSHVAVVHVAKAKLQLDDGDYRALLRRVAGVASSKDLDEAGFKALMEEFKRLGFTSTAAAERQAERSRPRNHATGAQRRFIQETWDNWKGEHDEEGLRRWLSRHFEVAHLRFVSARLAPKVIAALRNFPPRDPAKKSAGRKRAAKSRRPTTTTSAPPENTPTA